LTVLPAINTITSITFKHISGSRYIFKNSIEAIVNHFKLYSGGYNLPKGCTYSSTESPKGEFGVFLVSCGKSRAYRCKIKSPAFTHLQLLPLITAGHIIPDLVTVIGTLDIVFGEVDR
jgi:NADH dehydrogenase (ubiquinone) Fe-S protein 2